MFLKLTSFDNSPEKVIVNSDHIVTIFEKNNSTLIHLTQPAGSVNPIAIVTESVEEISVLLNAAHV